MKTKVFLIISMIISSSLLFSQNTSLEFDLNLKSNETLNDFWINGDGHVFVKIKSCELVNTDTVYMYYLAQIINGKFINKTEKFDNITMLIYNYKNSPTNYSYYSYTNDSTYICIGNNKVGPFNYINDELAYLDLIIAYDEENIYCLSETGEKILIGSSDFIIRPCSNYIDNKSILGCFLLDMDSTICIYLHGKKSKNYDEISYIAESADGNKIVYLASKDPKKFVIVNDLEFGPFDEVFKLTNYRHFNLYQQGSFFSLSDTIPAWIARIKNEWFLYYGSEIFKINTGSFYEPISSIEDLIENSVDINSSSNTLMYHFIENNKHYIVEGEYKIGPFSGIYRIGYMKDEKTLIFGVIERDSIIIYNGNEKSGLYDYEQFDNYFFNSINYGGSQNNNYYQKIEGGKWYIVNNNGYKSKPFSNLAKKIYESENGKNYAAIFETDNGENLIINGETIGNYTSVENVIFSNFNKYAYRVKIENNLYIYYGSKRFGPYEDLTSVYDDFRFLPNQKDFIFKIKENSTDKNDTLNQTSDKFYLINEKNKIKEYDDAEFEEEVCILFKDKKVFVHFKTGKALEFSIQDSIEIIGQYSGNQAVYIKIFDGKMSLHIGEKTILNIDDAEFLGLSDKNEPIYLIEKDGMWILYVDEKELYANEHKISIEKSDNGKCFEINSKYIYINGKIYPGQLLYNNNSLLNDIFYYDKSLGKIIYKSIEINKK